jgi:hypothetical protein
MGGTPMPRSSLAALAGAALVAAGAKRAGMPAFAVAREDD